MNSRRVLIALTISLIILVLLFQFADPGKILTVLTQITWQAILLGFVLSIASYFLRALRFYILLQKRVSFSELLSVVAVQNLLVNTTPSRVGDVSFLYILKKKNHIGAIQSASALVIARIFDFTVIMLCLFFSLLFTPNTPEAIAKALPAIVAMVVGLNIFLLILVYHGRKAQSAFEKILGSLNLVEKFPFPFLLEKTQKLCESFEQIKSRKIFFTTLVISALSWFTIYSTSIVLIRGLGFDFPAPLIVVGATAAMFSAFLPIQGLGGFGTIEAAWVVVLLPFGYSPETIILASLNSHIIYLFYYTLMGIWGMWRLSSKDHPS